MDIATALAQSPAAQPTRQPRTLEGIGEAAGRVMRLCGYLDAILERANGPSPETAEDADKLLVSYTSDLSRLHANLTEVERRIELLSQFA